MPKPRLPQKTTSVILTICFAIISLALRPLPLTQEITPQPENTTEPNLTLSDPSQLLVFVPECEGEECTFHQEMWPADQLEVIPEADETVTALAAAQITDLSAKPLPDGDWKICYTAPSGTDAGAVLEFRSRDNDPLTLANWNDRDWSDGYGTAYWSGMGHPGTPGVYRCLYMETEYPEWGWDMYGIREYFGARVINGDGSVSSISNIPSLYDTGFRPFPDGYNFENSGRKGSITIDDLRTLFGDNNVCNAVTQATCFPKLTALNWMNYENNVMRGGHCYGMANTSVNFFRGYDNPSRLGASKTWGLSPLSSKVWKNIDIDFVKQHIYPFSKQDNDTLDQDDLRSILNKTYSSQFAQSIIIINGKGGHAVTAYATEELGNGNYRLWIYDNNIPYNPAKPNDSMVFIGMNNVGQPNESWYYQGGMNWTGGSNKIGITPPRVQQQPGEYYSPPWGKLFGFIDLRIEGEMNLLVTDSLGRKTGYENGVWINEIPDAYENILKASYNLNQSGLVLPANNTYTITLDGQYLSEAEAASLSQFGPGFAIILDDLIMSPGGQSSLTIAPDGAQVSLQSGEDQSATSLSMTRDDEQTSTEFQIAQAEVSAGETLSLTADDGSGAMIFQNGELASTTYRASINRSSESGRELFLAKDLSAAPGETYAFDTASWFGPEGINVLVDENNDGSFDSSMYLDNQAAYLFVPLISDSGPNSPSEAAQPASEIVQPAAVQPTPTATPTQVPMEPSPTATRALTATASLTNEPTDQPTATPLILTVADTNGSGAQAILTLPDPQTAADLTVTLEDGELTLRSDSTIESQIDIVLKTEDGAPPKIYNGLRVKAKGVYVLSPEQNQQILALKADLDGDGQFEVKEQPASQIFSNTVTRQAMIAFVGIGILFGLMMIAAGILLLVRVRREI